MNCYSIKVKITNNCVNKALLSPKDSIMAPYGDEFLNIRKTKILILSEGVLSRAQNPIYLHVSLPKLASITLK